MKYVTFSYIAHTCFTEDTCVSIGTTTTITIYLVMAGCLMLTWVAGTFINIWREIKCFYYKSDTPNLNKHNHFWYILINDITQFINIKCYSELCDLYINCTHLFHRGHLCIHWHNYNYNQIFGHGRLPHVDTGRWHIHQYLKRNQMFLLQVGHTQFKQVQSLLIHTNQWYISE